MVLPNQDQFLRWLREENINPRPVSDEKCEFSYAIDRVYGFPIILAFAKPKSSPFIILQSLFTVPHQDHKILSSIPSRVRRKIRFDLEKGILQYPLFDFSIIDKDEVVQKTSLITHLDPNYVSKKELVENILVIKRANQFLKIFFENLDSYL